MDLDSGLHTCLVCSAKDIPLQPLRGYTSDSSVVQTCSDQVQVVLLLRKVLRLRRNFLESMLQSTGDNPASWDLKLCNVCHRIFEEASFVCSRLSKLNNEFEELSETLRSKLVACSNSEIHDSNELRPTSDEFPVESDIKTRPKRKVGRPRKTKDTLPIKRVIKIDTSDKNDPYSLSNKIRREALTRSNVHDAQKSLLAPPPKDVTHDYLLEDDIQDDDETPCMDMDDDDMLEEASLGEDFNENDDSEVDVNAVLADTDGEVVPNVDCNSMDADFTPDGPEDSDQGENEEVEDGDSDDDYQPEAKTSKRRSRARVKQQERGLMLKAIKMENKKSYECSKCRLVFESSSLCNEHILNDHYGGNWPQDFECHLCEGKRFNGEYWLRNHIKMRHPGEKLPSDEILERSIQEGSASELTYKVVPLGHKRDPTSADADSKDFLIKPTQRVYTKGDEAPPAKFSVPIRHVSGKMQHLILPDDFLRLPKEILGMITRGEEDKQCPGCPKTFPTEMQLKGHILWSHEGNNYCYPCPLCPRKFERIGKVLSHMQLIHIRNFRHFCNRCGQTFEDDLLLQGHVQQKHFGISYPFKCIICEIRHARRTDLNKHLKRVHKLQIEILAPISKPSGIKQEKKIVKAKKPAFQSRRKGIPNVKVKNIPCQVCEEEKQIVMMFGSQQELDVHVKRKHMAAPPEDISQDHLVDDDIQDDETPCIDDNMVEESNFDEDFNESNEVEDVNAVLTDTDGEVVPDVDCDSMDADYAPDGPEDSDSDQGENDEVEDDDSDDDYQPEAKTPKRRSRARVNQLERGLMLKSVKIENNSYECSKCKLVFESSGLCNEHILNDHYGGNWPQDFECHLCEGKRFRGEYWLRNHMKMRHPGEKLPSDEILERSIQEGSASELTYKVVPLGHKRDPISETVSNDLFKPSQMVCDEAPPDKFSVPILQMSGKIKHLILPEDFLKLPKAILGMITRGEEDKPCPQCPKTLPTEMQLKGHILWSHEGLNNCYPCPLCPRRFERIGKVLSHIQLIHIRNFRHFCNRCGQTFEDDLLLQAHVQQKHFGISYPYKCIICEIRHARRTDLNKHLKSVHKLQIESLAPIRKPSGIKQEKKIVKEKKPGFQFRRKKIPNLKVKNIPCQVCEEEKQIVMMFGSQQELDVHVKRKHMGISRPYACTICKKKFCHPLNLEAHMPSHTVRSDEAMVPEEPSKPQPRLYDCYPCNKSFKSKLYLNAHLLGKAHKDHRPFVCEICSQTFRVLRNLENHQTLVHHEELKLTPHKCKFCERILASKKSLDNHIKVVHEKNTKFKCPHCKVCFAYESILKRHINSRHTKTNFVLCPHCPKTFLNKQYLTSHLRVHTGEKPHQCKICLKKFSDKPTYNRHVEAHSNIIHDCPHCGKTGYKTRHALRVHVRTNHPEAIQSAAVGQDQKPQVPMDMEPEENTFESLLNFHE